MLPLIVLRTLWTLPTTAIGLALGLLATPFGARWQFRQGVLECYGGLIETIMRKPPWQRSPGVFIAITFGDVILGRSPAALDMARNHEHVHVRQAHLWGPVFCPAYVLASIYQYVRGRDPYRDNPFERQAYRLAP